MTKRVDSCASNEYYDPVGDSCVSDCFAVGLVAGLDGQTCVPVREESGYYVCGADAFVFEADGGRTLSQRIGVGKLHEGVVCACGDEKPHPNADLSGCEAGPARLQGANECEERQYYDEDEGYCKPVSECEGYYDATSKKCVEDCGDIDLVDNDVDDEASPKMCITKGECKSIGFLTASEGECVKATDCGKNKVGDNVTGSSTKGTCVANKTCTDNGYLIVTEEKTCVSKDQCYDMDMVSSGISGEWDNECFTKSTCASEDHYIHTNKKLCVESCYALGDNTTNKVIPDINGVDCTEVPAS